VEILNGTERIPIVTDVVDFHPHPPGVRVRKQWWKEVLEKTDKGAESKK
jgi:hypothetical protein